MLVCWLVGRVDNMCWLIGVGRSYYDEGSLMLADESNMLAELLLGLNCIDFRYIDVCHSLPLLYRAILNNMLNHIEFGTATIACFIVVFVCCLLTCVNQIIQMNGQ